MEVSRPLPPLPILKGPKPILSLPKGSLPVNNLLKGPQMEVNLPKPVDSLIKTPKMEANGPRLVQQPPKALQPEISPRTAPQPENSSRNAPKPEISPRKGSQPENSSRKAPQPENSSRNAPQPENSSRNAPKPEISPRKGSQPVQPIFKSPQQVQPLLTVPCDLHVRQVYTSYCWRHDQVCCAVCINTCHQSCDVSDIWGVAKAMLESLEVNKFTHAVKEVQTNLEKIKTKRTLDIQRLATEKDVEISKIQKTVAKMVEQAEAIGTSAIEDVKRKYNELKSKIESDLNKVDKMVKSLNIKIDRIRNTNNETEKFVYVNTCKNYESNYRNLLEDIQAHAAKEQLMFQIDERAAESVQKLRSLGKLIHAYQYTVVPEGQHRVDGKDDEKVCYNVDICFAEDGTILMTDWNNKSLKRFDKSFNAIDHLKLDASPWGVCSIKPTGQVAVTVSDSNTVQLVTVKGTMSKSLSSKTTGGCSGIAYHADHLYVTCGGSFSDGSGHIAVYSIQGNLNLVSKFETDGQGQLFLSAPLGVTVTSSRSTDDVIFVCDRDNGLVTLGRDGQRIWTLTCKELGMDSATRICVDSFGHALVSSGLSSKVVLVSGDGKTLGVVLTARDGIVKPQALCFDTQRSRLIVGMANNNAIHTFKLT